MQITNQVSAEVIQATSPTKIDMSWTPMELNEFRLAMFAEHLQLEYLHRYSY